MEKKLPVYELMIDDNLDSDVEVNCVALVDRPAIERNFLTFKEAPAPFAFATVNDEEQILLGPAMIPDQPIYRADENGEYFVTFSKDTIQQTAIKFFEKGYQKSVNIMHDPNQPVDDVVFFMSFIKDGSKGITGLEGDYPDGTWFLGAKVKSPETWARVKSGEVKGFSVEGIFSYKRSKPTPEEMLAQLKDILKDF